MELVYTSNVPDRLKFEKSTIPEEHSDGDVIENLNVLFLQEFFKKLKSQISPGFDNRNLKTNQKTLSSTVIVFTRQRERTYHTRYF